MAKDVTVADAIKALRADLEDAQQEGEGGKVRFLAKSVEVELAIVLKDEVKAGAGLKAWFVDLSAKGKASDENSHKIKLVLEPVDSRGRPTMVFDPELEK
jgi:hypothetical protein